jgi:hypothetical protein
MLRSGKFGGIVAVMNVAALSAPTGMIKQTISMSMTDTEITSLPAAPGDC